MHTISTQIINKKELSKKFGSSKYIAAVHLTKCTNTYLAGIVYENNCLVFKLNLEIIEDETTQSGQSPEQIEMVAALNTILLKFDHVCYFSDENATQLEHQGFNKTERSRRIILQDILEKQWYWSDFDTRMSLLEAQKVMMNTPGCEQVMDSEVAEPI